MLEGGSTAKRELFCHTKFVNGDLNWQGLVDTAIKMGTWHACVGESDYKTENNCLRAWYIQRSGQKQRNRAS